MCKIEEKIVGKFKDQDVTEYKITNDNGMYVSFVNPGGTVRELVVKDKNGKFRDILLQYKDLDGIYENSGHLGAIVARNANRIAEGKFSISEKVYVLEKNNGENNLHSGPDYFYTKKLIAEKLESKEEASVIFTYKFKNMEQGFPGNCDFIFTYTLTNNNEFKIRYECISDEDTVFNPTWHAYFNLKGHNAGDIISHKLKIFADKYTCVNDKLIPTDIRDVKGTAFDFVSDFKGICDDIESSDEQMKLCDGYDHNFALNNYDGSVRLAADVKELESGIEMLIYTDAPGAQLYTANGLMPKKACKGDKPYNKRGGFCFETQYFPNAINDKRFASPIVKKGEKKVLNTIFAFR